MRIIHEDTNTRKIINGVAFFFFIKTNQIRKSGASASFHANAQAVMSRDTLFLAESLQLGDSSGGKGDR